MKLIIDSEKMFKLAITPEGSLSINLANGKTLQGTLTPEEIEQIHFRVMQVSEGALKFDPEPQDYVSLHKSDTLTLEAQAVELDRLRSVIEAAKQSEQDALTAKAQLENQLLDCEQMLSSTRTELKNALEVVEQQAAKLNIVKPEPIAEEKPVVDEAAPVREAATPS